MHEDKNEVAAPIAVEGDPIDYVIGDLEDVLSRAGQLRDGSRTEKQRCIVILNTKIEDALAWAIYTSSKT